MHLGMIEEAKNLLQEVNRWDLLIHFYIAIGEYDKAIETSKKYDRINLENTFYRIAEHYERLNDIEKAMDYYKLANCGNREIARMLVQKNKIDILENYMLKGNDPNSILWWASYLEGQNQIDKALTFYEKAKSFSNIVRLLLVSSNLNDAKNICDKTKDSGACYLLGKYYESIDDIKNAINYYAASGRVSQAFKLAKEHNMDTEIYNLGLKANVQTQNLIAQYLENRGLIEKAINLYLSGSNIKKALNLCFITQQYDKIREIADNVEYKNDKETLKSLAEYFIEQNQVEKALGLFIKLKDFDRAMSLSEKNKVKISLQTCNAILEELEADNNSSNKSQLITKLAKFLMMQGDFELSSQIYVKMGNFKKAMKCWIKMGNRLRVTEFAQTCRIPELYIMAANFLQSCDWNDSEDIVKTIVSFYTKAKAYFNLASFYELFANVEISEYRNYDKALELYQEAINALEKSKENEEKKNEKIAIFQNKMKMTKLYLFACSIIKSNEQEALKICNELLNVVNFSLNIYLFYRME